MVRTLSLKDKINVVLMVWRTINKRKGYYMQMIAAKIDKDGEAISRSLTYANEEFVKVYRETTRKDIAWQIFMKAVIKKDHEEEEKESQESEVSQSKEQ